ncbi:hypothetical protein OK016_14600 [Vibrio chagasii]|nr:hypothetical protein [Vibrio chagasii]
MPMQARIRLLRVLQERVIEKGGLKRIENTSGYPRDCGH